MKATYEKFIEENQVCKNLADNRDAKAIFEILNRNEQIYDAISASDRGRPALAPNVDLLEEYINSRGEATTFDLSSTFHRTAVGRMEKTILKPFGYEPSNVQKSLIAGHFKSASCYEYVGNEEMKLVINAVEAKEDNKTKK